MSYSFTKSGTKQEVCDEIDAQVGSMHPAAAEAFKRIVQDDLHGDSVSFTASGHNNSCSLSISSWVAGASQGG